MHNLLVSRVWDLLAESSIDQGFICGYICVGIAFVLGCHYNNKGEQSVALADLPPVGSACCIPTVISSFLHNVFILERDLE